VRQVRQVRQVFGSLVAAAALVVLAGCGGSDNPGVAPSPSRTPSPTSSQAPSPTPSSTPSPSDPDTHTSSPEPEVTKVLVFVLENHSLDAMRAQLPYTFSLAQRYGYATAYRGVAHPSLPNYLAMLGGSTFGVVDDHDPSAHPITGSSVFGQALAAGHTAGLYAEGMPAPCATENGGERYAVRHNPWAYFVDERASCERHDVPLSALPGDLAAGRLPDVGLVIPDTCNDAHDCDASVADAWLRDQLGPVLAGPDWHSGHLAVVITADEDHYDQDNLVLTTVLHPSLHGVVVDADLTHLSLSRFLDEVLGLPALREAAEAPSMAEAFGLSVAGLRG
jgi:acid phosphatase